MPEVFVIDYLWKNPGKEWNYKTAPVCIRYKILAITYCTRYWLLNVLHLDISWEEKHFKMEETPFASSAISKHLLTSAEHNSKKFIQNIFL